MNFTDKKWLSIIPLTCLPLTPFATTDRPVSADVIVVIDESGSMSTEQAWIRDMIPSLENNLRLFNIGNEGQSNLYGLVGFGRSGSEAARSILIDGEEIGGVEEFIVAADELVTNGGTEDGWAGLNLALSEYTHRDGSALNIILATDEDRDEVDSTLNLETLGQLLDQNRALLNAVLNITIVCDTETETEVAALGMDNNGIGYRTDENGTFSTCTNPQITNASENTEADYANLALESGGAIWDLNILRSGGDIADSFTAAFLEIKKDEILAQRPVGDLAAVANANPNPALTNQEITLDARNSFHQQDDRSIVSFEWDIDNDGTFDLTGPLVTARFPDIEEYPITLRITDDSQPPLVSEATVILDVNQPPIAPTANTNGPYFLCPQDTQLILDGSLSVNPDDGNSELNQPADFITAYEWDLDDDLLFDDSTEPTVDVTDQFRELDEGEYFIRLRVTDNSALSFPSADMGNLSDFSVTQVNVLNADNIECLVCELQAENGQGLINLTWTAHPEAFSYEISRRTGDETEAEVIATVEAENVEFMDVNVEPNTRYIYSVRAIEDTSVVACSTSPVEIQTQPEPTAVPAPVDPVDNDNDDDGGSLNLGFILGLLSLVALRRRFFK